MSKMGKKYSVRYQSVTVYFNHPVRRDVCDACGKSKEKGQIKNTQGHHWIYAYKPSTVKKNPELALENRSELCYTCHQLADALRALCELKPKSLKKIIRVALLMPNDFQKNLTIIAKLWNYHSRGRAKKLLEFEPHV